MKFTDIKLTREERNREKLFLTADEIDSSPINELDTCFFSQKTRIMRKSPSPGISELEENQVSDYTPAPL